MEIKDQLKTLEKLDEQIQQKCDFGTYSAIATQLLMCPAIKKSLYRYALALNNQISSVKLRMASIDNRTLGELSSEKQEDGKPIFSNKESRDAEKFARLKEDVAFQEAKFNCEELIAKQKESQSEIEFVTEVFNRNKYLIKLLEVEKNDRV